MTTRGAATIFYKPTLAKATAKELAFAKKRLAERFRRSSELDVPDFDFVFEDGEHLTIPTRRIAAPSRDDFNPDYLDMKRAFQVTYNFSSAVRRNDFPMKNALSFSRVKLKGEYGASGWSFRMLYEFLCAAYNGGELFIDTYFGTMFKTRPCYYRLLNIYSIIWDRINNERYDAYMRLPKKPDGSPDERFAAYKKYKDYSVWADASIRAECKGLAKAIRFDIERCLATGKLALNGRNKVAKATAQRRDTLTGMIHPNRLFYASGQLIQHLNIYVEIDKREFQAA